MRLRWRVFFAVVDSLGAAALAVARALRCHRGGVAIHCHPKGGKGTVPFSPRENRDSPHRENRDSPQATQDEPKVVLLVQLDHLGDAIISTAMLPALRRHYPAASIEVLAGAWNREVFELAPEVDRVHVSRINRFARTGLARLAWIPATFWWGLALRRRKVDLGIDPRGEFPVAVMLWLCGARRRLGWACGGGGFLLTDLAEFLPDRPEVESRMALLAALRIDPAHRDASRPRIRPTAAARQRIARELAEFSRDAPAGPLVVLHVGAGAQAKSWPAGHWHELLGRIIVDYAARAILVGSHDDRAIAQRILAGRVWPGVSDWTGRLSLVELAALLERADVMLGSDSGPAHLAAAVGTATVVLFSGTNSPRQWRPCGQQVSVIRQEVGCSPCHRQRCPRPGHPCMRRLRPRRVAARLRSVLRRQLGRERRCLM